MGIFIPALHIFHSCPPHFSFLPSTFFIPCPGPFSFLPYTFFIPCPGFFSFPLGGGGYFIPYPGFFSFPWGGGYLFHCAKNSQKIINIGMVYRMSGIAFRVYSKKVISLEKKKKKRGAENFFYLISPQREHFRTKFKRILEAMFQGYNFRFLTILGSWSCDHPPQMDPDMYHHSYLSLFHFLDISNDITFFEYTLKAIPDILYTIPMFIIFWLFLAQ
jgi:hypothetical protein